MATARPEAVGSEESLGGSTAVHGGKRREVRQAEGAKTLGPQGRGSGTGAHASPVAEGAPPAEKLDLTRAGTEAERGKPVVLPEGKARRKVSREDGGYRRREQAQAAWS